MKKFSNLLAGSLLLCLLAGCTSVKRFKSAKYIGEDNSLVRMELFGSKLGQKLSQSPQLNLWGLSASAQAQFIQILNQRFPDNEQFMGALSHQYLNGENYAPLDMTEKQLKLVFTISKKRNYKEILDRSGLYSPADRIEFLSFYLELPEAYNLRYKTWNKFTTEYGEIEIADVSFNRVMEVEADGTAFSSMNGGGQGSLSRNEKQNIRSRFLNLNGTLSERVIRIEEEGTREIDLTGNVEADVTIQFAGFPERITLPKFTNGKDGIKQVIALEFIDILVPRIEDAPDTIKALLNMEYIYRHVQSGWKTYPEWDDRVEYYSGTFRKEVPLFTRADYLPALYAMGTEVAGKKMVSLRSTTGVDYPLQFRHYSEAGQFLAWLLSSTQSRNHSQKDVESEAGKAVKVGTHTLIWEGDPLTIDRLEQLDLKVVLVY
jgi:hypothetical protein